MIYDEIIANLELKKCEKYNNKNCTEAGGHEIGKKLKKRATRRRKTTDIFIKTYTEGSQKIH